jgi:cytochrome d ubiquinol oxidase subunit II
MINAIGPVWDGNEVWLVTGGGALFAAFPNVYATVASGFYLAVMLLLFGLIFRAVAIEFRSKQPMRWWRRLWDVCFCVSSIVVSLVLGIAFGNIIRGIPLDAAGDYTGTFLALFNPYACLVGVSTVILFMFHGSVYASLKTEGGLQARAQKWAKRCLIIFIACYVILTLATFKQVPLVTGRFIDNPILFLIPAVNIFVMAAVPWAINRRKDLLAMVFSSVNILALLLVVFIGMFPNIVLSTSLPEYTLTAYNAASSVRGLNYMLNIALLGMPLVLAYTATIHWVFRGKSKITKDNY